MHLCPDRPEFFPPIALTTLSGGDKTGRCFFAGDDDFLYYLDTLKKWKAEFGCKVFTYCLMTNHIHLVVGPGDHPENISLLMKRLAGRQARYVNHQEGRSGSLWEGRYKSSTIQTDWSVLEKSVLRTLRRWATSLLPWRIDSEILVVGDKTKANFCTFLDSSRI